MSDPVVRVKGLGHDFISSIEWAKERLIDLDI